MKGVLFFVAVVVTSAWIGCVDTVMEHRQLSVDPSEIVKDNFLAKKENTGSQQPTIVAGSVIGRWDGSYSDGKTPSTWSLQIIHNSDQSVATVSVKLSGSQGQLLPLRNPFMLGGPIRGSKGASV